MPQPIFCLDEEVCHFAERFRSLFSKPQYQCEPFYNGQARVEDVDGSLLVINERGEMLVRLRPHQ